MFFIFLPTDGFYQIYQKAPRNKNCKAHEIITTEDVCKDASKELRLTYNSKITRDFKSRPLGCYYSYYTDQTWFNENVNGTTNPAVFGEYGGVCHLSGKLCYTKI